MVLSDGHDHIRRGRPRDHAMRVRGGNPPRPQVDLHARAPRPKSYVGLWASSPAWRRADHPDDMPKGWNETTLTPTSREPVYGPLLVGAAAGTRHTTARVSIHRQFKVLVEDRLDTLFADGGRVVAEPSASRPIDAAVRERQWHRLLIAVGPEGGWNEFERGLSPGSRLQSGGDGSACARSDNCLHRPARACHSAMTGPEARRRPPYDAMERTSEHRELGGPVSSRPCEAGRASVSSCDIVGDGTCVKKETSCYGDNA